MLCCYCLRLSTEDFLFLVKFQGFQDIIAHSSPMFAFVYLFKSNSIQKLKNIIMYRIIMNLACTNMQLTGKQKNMYQNYLRDDLGTNHGLEKTFCFPFFPRSTNKLQVKNWHLRQQSAVHVAEVEEGSKS